MTFVATDGKRVAVAEHELEDSVDEGVQVILPAKTMQEVCANLSNDDVTIMIGTSHIMFVFKDMIVTGRLIEGQYPNYEMVIPAVSENKLIIKRDVFMNTISRAAVLKTDEYISVAFELLKNKLIVSKSTPDLGEFSEELEVTHKGNDVKIGFQPDYLLDVLRVLKEETIVLEVTEFDKPCVIRTSNSIHVVLPARIR